MIYAFIPLSVADTMDTIGWILLSLVAAVIFFITYSIFKGMALYGSEMTIGAPGSPIEKVADSVKKSSVANEMSVFIHKDDTFFNDHSYTRGQDYTSRNRYQDIKSIDMDWLKSFIGVCHWAGLRVVLVKESDKDIEPSDSVAYNERRLFDFSKKHYVLNKETLKAYQQFEGEEKKSNEEINKMLEF